MKSLLRLKKNIYSQNGEDGVLDYLVVSVLADRASRTCCEFGAWDGIHLSNTANLIRNHGFRGVFIEADPEKCKGLLANYADFPTVAAVSDIVDLHNLDDILGATDLPSDFDVLSIDIDSYDSQVWRNLLNYRPKIVILETTIGFGPKRVAESMDFCSPAASVKIAQQKGYELVAHIGSNCIFIDRNYYPLVGLEGNSLEDLWDRESPGLAPKVVALSLLLGERSPAVRLVRVIKRMLGLRPPRDHPWRLKGRQRL